MMTLFWLVFVDFESFPKRFNSAQTLGRGAKEPLANITERHCWDKSRMSNPGESRRSTKWHSQDGVEPLQYSPCRIPSPKRLWVGLHPLCWQRGIGRFGCAGVRGLRNGIFRGFFLKRRDSVLLLLANSSSIPSACSRLPLANNRNHRKKCNRVRVCSKRLDLEVHYTLEKIKYNTYLEQRKLYNNAQHFR